MLRSIVSCYHTWVLGISCSCIIFNVRCLWWNRQNIWNYVETQEWQVFQRRVRCSHTCLFSKYRFIQSDILGLVPDSLNFKVPYLGWNLIWELWGNSGEGENMKKETCEFSYNGGSVEAQYTHNVIGILLMGWPITSHLSLKVLHFKNRTPSGSWWKIHKRFLWVATLCNWGL